MENIPFFNYSSLFTDHEQEYRVAIESVLKRGAFIMQDEMFEFEQKLSDYLQVKYAIGVADGTMALLLSLKVSNIGPGDEVIVPSHTFAASASAIAQIGATPVLADCGEDHLIDANSVEKLINKNTKVIMPVHLNGRTANMEKILDLSEANNILIVEDACQALGSKYNNVYAGTFGLAGAFSFYPSKTLGCFGDGGAIITNDHEAARRIKLLRDHGRNEDGIVEEWGLNSRLDNLQAAILLVKFKYYQEEIEHRRLLAAEYNKQLKNTNGIKLPPPPDSSPDHFDIYQNYEVEVEDRDKLRSFLSKNNIGTIMPWGGFSLHNFDALNLNGIYDYTEKIADNFLLLPLHSSLEIEQVEFICERINSFYN